jgi:hypothetical protein
LRKSSPEQVLVKGHEFTRADKVRQMNAVFTVCGKTLLKGTKWQGMTLVVPIRAIKWWGFNPCVIFFQELNATH